jgi:hypothetical protein
MSLHRWCNLALCLLRVGEPDLKISNLSCGSVAILDLFVRIRKSSSCEACSFCANHSRLIGATNWNSALRYLRQEHMTYISSDLSAAACSLFHSSCRSPKNRAFRVSTISCRVQDRDAHSRYRNAADSSRADQHLAIT